MAETERVPQGDDPIRPNPIPSEQEVRPAMLRHASKLLLEILCSVLATVIGSYVANHYIAGRFARETPVPIERATLATNIAPSEVVKAEIVASAGPSNVVNAPDAAGTIGSRIVDNANDEKAAQPGDRSAELASVITRQHRPPRGKRIPSANAIVVQEIVSATAASAEMGRPSVDRAVDMSTESSPGAAPTPLDPASRGSHFARRLLNPIIHTALLLVGRAHELQRRASPDDVPFSSREFRFQPEAAERSSSERTTISSDPVSSDRPGTKLPRQWP
jgi:hypothetical protein